MTWQSRRALWRPRLCTGHLRPVGGRREPCLGQPGGAMTGPSASGRSLSASLGPEGAEPSAQRVPNRRSARSASDGPSVDVPAPRPPREVEAPTGASVAPAGCVPGVQASTVNTRAPNRSRNLLTWPPFSCQHLQGLRFVSFFFCGELSSAVGAGSFGGIFMMMFSHWGSLVSESCVYFKSKSLERSFRFFKYSRWIIVS